MKTEDKRITLTTAEILDLSKAANLIPHKAKLSDFEDDGETEFTIIEQEGGMEIGDEDGKNPKKYAHGAFLTEYPEEGTYPLGPELHA